MDVRGTAANGINGARTPDTTAPTDEARARLLILRTRILIGELCTCVPSRATSWSARTENWVRASSFFLGYRARNNEMRVYR